MSDTNAMVAEVLKALVARNASKRAKSVLMPKPEAETTSQESEISDEDMAALLEMGGEEDEEKMEA